MAQVGELSDASSLDGVNGSMFVELYSAAPFQVFSFDLYSGHKDIKFTNAALSQIIFPSGLALFL